ncbi:MULTISPECIES: YrrS family protein [Metabacillus]|uniref:YrrS family protein n=1 Tax=Metabacillus hrfriensis TaxID=3048891 RepID=A0ACD4R815_9BACI|nr:MULTISPECIES: YrrS family protein [Metabacillus]UAL51127.1 YrrS family protein [Metabacillus dongyingensis]UOK57107.1 YrrS family protein [Bacillus sp. OVS6]USK27419.1 YrrS family protein [Bacillus sp. CMF21]WHZ56631.1 YrrS family protein [Metabacillus sp. CT-WN-B3]
MHLSKLSKGSRFENRDKRRKANVVLNILIGIVVILILVIGSQLMLGGDDSEQASKDTEEETGSNQIENEKNKEEKDKEQTAKEDAEADQDGSEEEDAAKEEENAEEQPEESEAGEEVVTEGDPNSNVDQIIENPGWKPVGTSQSGTHTAQYDKNSQDWAEMIKAMSYATGLSESDMTIWFIGNNGSPNDAKGTISSKDKTQNYKVEITWVENEGWKPVKVEKLKQTETR